jgi:ketosteroid isomerase-like protein
MSMLKDLTKAYVAAFNAKNEAACAALMAPDFALEDPVVVRIEGREKVMEAIRLIFAASEHFAFTAQHIFQDGDTTFIEFHLTIGDKTLKGVDIIEWKNGLMVELRAYLDV